MLMPCTVVTTHRQKKLLRKPYSGYAFFFLCLVAGRAEAKVIFQTAPEPIESCGRVLIQSVKGHAEAIFRAFRLEQETDLLKLANFDLRFGYTRIVPIREVPGAFLSMSYNHETMNQMYDRLSIFDTGFGAPAYRGKLVPFITLDDFPFQLSISGGFTLQPTVKGHNLTGKGVRDFFRMAAQQNSPLNPWERELHGAIREPLLETDSDFYLIASSFFSNPLEDPVDTPSHELCHAEFYLNRGYQAAIFEFWNSKAILDEDKMGIASVLTELGYDIEIDIHQFVDEFQAYTLQVGAENGRLKAFVPKYRKPLLEFLDAKGIVPARLR